MQTRRRWEKRRAFTTERLNDAAHPILYCANLLGKKKGDVQTCKANKSQSKGRGHEGLPLSLLLAVNQICIPGRPDNELEVRPWFSVNHHGTPVVLASDMKPENTSMSRVRFERKDNLFAVLEAESRTSFELNLYGKCQSCTHHGLFHSRRRTFLDHVRASYRWSQLVVEWTCPPRKFWKD